jgi:ABC-type cobalamin/Fe3+-siderophores transport system ATPase subunit
LLVVIARAVAQAAPLIVMDEPTASLDFGNQVLVLSEVRRLAARGTGVILATHDPDHAFAIASRVALIRNGRFEDDERLCARQAERQLEPLSQEDVTWAGRALELWRTTALPSGSRQ